MQYKIQPIGHIRTPYQSISDCPRNVDVATDRCQVVLDHAFIDGLSGLAPGDRVVLLYWLDKASFGGLQRPSRRTGEVKGIFALRTPHRPNPIGMAEVTIERMTAEGFTVLGLDCLDATALLDIKPAMH